MDSPLAQQISFPIEVGEPEPVAATSAPPDRCIHELFEQQVAANPDEVALVCGSELLTYRQLNRRANRLARHLRRRGVGTDALVGICMHRCVEMVVSLLGILKAGGAYVPLDPAYPKHRLNAMLNDVELALLLTNEELLEELTDARAPIVCVDREREEMEAESAENLGGVSPDSLAYAIFTSGSTGQAKVAAVYQRGWTNLLRWFMSAFEIDADDRVLVISSFSFDITQRSIAMPLVVGGQLHLLDSCVYDPMLIREVLERDEITLVNCAPSTFYPLIETAGEQRSWSDLRIVFLGGEPISASRLRDWAQSPRCATELVNVYGVAECSDVSTFHRLRDYDRYAETSVPAGRPIFNTRVHVLDDTLSPVAIGERGEICITGAGVGMGYVNDPDLTERKFILDPAGDDPAARMYRTGDLGTLLEDGTLMLIGRVDHQVKIRGHRIDLGDVETSLRLHPRVREAVVVSRTFAVGDQRLIAYVVPADDDVTGHDLQPALREFMSQRVPEFMLPARFVPLEELPLNPNGKVDRTALAEREAPVEEVASDAVPRSPFEAQVADAFAEVLGVARIGIFDNFFDHGGDSYLLTVLLGRLTDFSGIRLSIFDFLSGPTVAEVTAAMEAQAAD